jgi:hypothetical protein
MKKFRACCLRSSINICEDSETNHPSFQNLCNALYACYNIGERQQDRASIGEQQGEHRELLID